MFIGETLLQPDKYLYIAKRTPSLQKLIIPPTLATSDNYIVCAMRYWKKLKQIQCPGKTIRYCCLRNVTSMRLLGAVNDNDAAAIRDRCPKLKRLRLISCALSANALSIILDGHKNLELLDTRNSFRVPDCSALSISGATINTLEWNEEEICHKAAGVKMYLTCDRRRCARCTAPIKYFASQSMKCENPELCWI